MSGPVANNVFRSSGVIASAAGGLNWQAVVTASTLTAEAGNGYLINTTSNTCTITLPASAEAGDQIIFADYARTWGTNKITIDSNGLNYQGNDDTYTVTYSTSGQTVSIVYSGATVGWIPEDDDTVADVPVAPVTQKAIFGYGNVGGGTPRVSVTNLVSSSGVVAADTTGVGTAREYLAAAGYGFDKALFCFGYVAGDGGATYPLISNLVSNSGVVATDTSFTGTGRLQSSAAGYGNDKAIVAYGESDGYHSLSNLVSNSGVVATDTTGVGTARGALGACGYGTDKAIFGYGKASSHLSLTNLVSNSGVVASDVTGVGTARRLLSACGYGGDKGIFAYGYTGSANTTISNLVSNVGVVATDVSGVGTAHNAGSSASYGGDKGIFAYGSGLTSVSNLVSNLGVVGSDVSGVGTAREGSAAAGYSNSA